ncbi:hypothetical protein N0V84_006986 [Fusarium piperis]|uniref:Uncharacterized protein n=1 Tax=Fusarium piperis TaxID=1435070 RepID=A0A9W9BNT9_9HYPO|nr:hypothetical protein N0V84_006986 [Fusarium piperis]
MTKSSIDAVHGSIPSTNGKHSDHEDGLHQHLHQDKAEATSSLHLQDLMEPVNARLQNPLHVAQPAPDAVSLHPSTGATPSATVPMDTISAKDLVGIGGQFSAERPAEKG